ncbi:uncharacterized protein L3040_009387 [Drepanopeziza brunnea f. sp. 'multigermtubi']|uniref:Uncharacterized protein n=1 Tax=Marssonina brunnea f. sp. multigermtubi (strain MB_m1) TaxID=1072389 RepID=K1X2G0_MARBU|nr:uncharacterized protein MBM_02409 [Drepanopeziza brunnea f. sp. 'multigermtubi' MB_m1]EKD19172.1 hypothetical protein MBM_02409 [Drepanopeziza brunnea f. sp. 'multigermtubi' MB_m1]KAJ5032795.1 hypothetical protein L3040_009387 [Drepanopeziza brunnea f. sp. 'multigermtubi']
MALSDDIRVDAEDHHGSVSEHDLAQTLQQIARGEKTAEALESNLTSLEKKIDDLLASFEETERKMLQEQGQGQGQGQGQEAEEAKGKQAGTGEGKDKGKP